MSADTAWTAADLPDLTGRTAIVTGANSGIGASTALELARAGANVVLACRDLGKAELVVAAIREARHAPNAAVIALELDLAQLGSVRKFSEAFLAGGHALDLLVNNAGVMAIPYRKTADGFEMQIGTNHLGHFALTGLLLEPLLASKAGRIVNVSSTMHMAGRMRFDDLQWERGYNKWLAYGQSKLANLLFSYELQRRLEAKGAAAISVACHPGYASTNLQTAGPRMAGSRVMESVWRHGTDLFAQSAEMGALPTLYAAAADGVRGGDYFGPGGFMGQRGHPVKMQSNRRSRDEASATRLWEISEELTGVRYEALH